MSVSLYPYISPELPVSTELPPFDFCPDVEIGAYHPDQAVKAASWFSQNAPLERLRIFVKINKAAYEAARASAGYLGNFSTNYVGVRVVTSNALPGGLPSGSPVLTPSVTDVGSEVVVSFDFRPPLFWAGTTRYVIVVVEFTHQGYPDYVVVPVQVTTALQNLVAETGDTPFDSFAWFQEGQEVAEICKEVPGEIELHVTHEKEGWFPLVLVHRDSQFSSEHDGFSPGQIPTVLNAPILSITSVVDSPNQTEVIRIDKDALNGDECFVVVIKSETPEDPWDPEEECTDSFDINIEIAVNYEFPEEITTITWGLDPSQPDLQSISFKMYGQDYFQYGQYFEREWSAASNTGSQEYVTPFGVLNYLMTFEVTVTMENGCVYSGTFNFIPRRGETEQYKIEI